MSTCDVSVVVATQNLRVELHNLLVSLADQTLAADRYEVIVVDDGSARSMADVVAPFLADGRVRFIRHEQARGAAAGRNSGLAAAEGALVVLIDGDCIAHPGLLEAHLAAHADGPVAVCGFTAGRELTPVQWQLIHGHDWDFSDSRKTFARAALTPTLDDPLTDLLAEPRPADWAFFWTTNVSMPASVFREIGGADESLHRLEDVDLGYRLARAGHPTVFAPEAKVLHQPHRRDRWQQVVADRRAEQSFVAKHPTLEVEAVCSYDIAGSREMVPAITAFASALAEDTADCDGLFRLERLTRRIEVEPSVLLVGSPRGWPRGLPAPEAVCYPGPLPEDGDARTLRLMGTRLPYPAQHFGLGIVTDYWRQLPEGLASRILGEMTRVCQDVVILSSVSAKPVPSPSADLVATLRTPYWDYALRVRQELHQFHLTEWERAGAAAAFRCARLDWPVVEL